MISHNLIDVFEVADQIAILRLGRIVASGPGIGDFDSAVVVDYMTTGRSERAVAGRRQWEWERTAMTRHRRRPDVGDGDHARGEPGSSLEERPRFTP